MGMAPARRQASPAVTLTVEAGYGGLYRQGQWLPVRVGVANDGDGLDGYVRARTGTLGGLEETTYRTPIALPRGARKQVYLYVSFEDFAQQLQVEIVARDGAIAARASVPVRAVGRGDLITAVISESTYGAADLAAQPPGASTVHQVLWRVDDIPPLAEALVGVDVMLFHDVDTGALRPEQVQALRRWVQGGGHLIVAGGNAWQRTTARLGELLPVTLQGTALLESAGALGDYLRQPDAALSQPITVAVAQPSPDARVLVAAEDRPLIVRQRLGSGWVDFVALEPQDAPLRTWSGMGDLWRILIVSTGQRPAWARGFADWSVAREATLTTSSSVLPTYLQLCGFLLVYVLLIGPVNYLLLKRLNRREWAWFTIPALIALFSALAYSVGFNLRGNVPVINRLTVIRAWDEGQETRVLSLIGVQSPRRRYHDVGVEQGFTLRTLPEEGIGINVPVTLTESTRSIAERILIDGGTIASLEATGLGSLPRLDASAIWVLGADLAPRISGKVTNTTGIRLEDAVILVKGEARKLGTLEPDQTVAFEIVLGAQGPAPLVGETALGRLGSIGPWRSGSSASWCFAHDGLALTVPDVMQGDSFACSVTRVSGRQQEIRRRYRLLGALVVDQDESGGRGDGAYLFAWAAHPTVTIELGAPAYETEDTVLYVFELPVTAASVGGLVDVPPALTGWTLSGLDDARTRLDLTPDGGFQVSQQDYAQFEYMPLPRLRLVQVEALMLEYQGQGNVLTELWNWEAQAWEPIARDPSSFFTAIPEAGRFAGPENAVRIRLSAPDATSYNRVNYVHIGYRGVLADDRALIEQRAG